MGRITQTESANARGLTGRYAPPAAARELTATSADGSRLHIEVHGRDGDPAVVLAHGWTCSTLFWAAVIRELTADGHRVIVYDQRGHGRSPAAVPHAYTPATLADDLCAVLDAVLEPGEKAVLGGHSMGGMTLMAAARTRQLNERAAALMLCSTGSHRLLAESRVIPLRSARARTAAHRLVLGARAPLGPVTPVSRAALKYGTLGPGATREQTEVVARIVHACPTGVRAAWGGVLADLDLHARVRDLRLPTAVISGTADRLTPYPHARGLAEALPDCVGLHELAGLGHMTPIEAPEAVAGVLRGLVREHLVPEPVGAGSDSGAAKRSSGKSAAKNAKGTKQQRKATGGGAAS
ncbi:alpha/beta hydrolase [Streptomyces sp. ODS28]|uniref:alpha/beta fold hydrolase n=1 Tax=Streptomyces sp. ODS28 TaxID=3136688 RepID=UPI0031E77EB7